MDEDVWDGVERRAVILADQQSKADGKVVDVPIAILIIGFAAVFLFQLTAVVQHGLLSRDVAREADAAQEARRQISCFVVGTAQGRPGPDLLTTCGFLKIGGD